MKQIRLLLSGLTIITVIAALTLIASVPATAAQDACSSGAHTLSKFGDRVYPEMGNGGYTSVHTDIYIVYDAASNLFLPGTHVDLTQQATQCLTDFSLDFERSSSDATAGPNMTVNSVTVNGDPATFTFVQPTYPGDPNGQNDPDPLAHAVSNVNPVSATNPNPPACSPQVSGNGQNGTQCPANKLVVTPSTPIPNGSTFVVSVAYTGRPGVHHDGDGTTEGWFRVNTTAAPNDGGFVTTEPVGNMAWMPLNNHPSAKPTYDVYDTVPVGKTAISAGELVGATPGPTFGTLAPTQVNPPDANFSGGSWTWHWHSPERIASYLIGNSIASYDLVAQTSTLTGIQYFQGQASAITTARKAINKIAMDTQEDLTTFQTMFNGPFPFTTNGVVVGIPSAGFEEEMQTKITFANGQIGGTSGTSLGTFAHENMHQWFGDNVSEAAFNLTFWKEGWATIGEYLLAARTAANTAGGLGTPAGNAAFDTSLINRFNTNYGTTSSTFWTSAPSNPTVGNLFSTASTYTRPGTAYLALRQILDASASRPASDRWIGAMKQIQSQYGGGSITEPQLEAVFHQWLPNQSADCSAKLDQFFAQWFDTAYPTPNNATNKPQITGPGINGPDHFYDDATACTRADQAITFSSLSDKLTDDPDFNVSATADSGLTVSFAASGQCTVSDTTVHITGAGSCTITAAQSGDGVFRPATSVPQTFGINKHPQTISFDPIAGKTYGDSDFGINPTATSGFAVSLAASGQCTLDSATSPANVHITGAGSCTIIAAQAGDANYNAAPSVAQTFAIAQAPLAVKPSPFTTSREYGEPNPAFSPIITGFVLGENASALTTVPTCVSNATATSAVPGPYPITCSGGAAANYSFAYTDGSLIITKATLTVTADNLTKIFNAPNPVFTFQITGFKNGESAAVLTTQPTCTSPATQTSPVGTYVITCSAGVASDYNFIYVNGTLTIIYNFTGFFSPIDNPPTLNSANSGQAIPLKWRITDANGDPVTNLANVTVKVVGFACSLGTTPDLPQESASGNSGLQNQGNGNYQFNWKTPKSYAKSCKTMKLDLGEGPGMERTALFQFVK